MRSIPRSEAWFRRTVMATILIFLAGVSINLSAGEQKAEREYSVPRAGTLKLRVPESWVDEVRQPPDDLPPTITFTPATGDSFEVLITAIRNFKNDSEFNKPPKIKSLVEGIGQKFLDTCEETELKIKGLRGPVSWGYRFSVTEKEEKPGEYQYMTQGALGVGDLLLTFTILTHEKESAVEKEAINMLRSARQDTSVTPEAPAKKSAEKPKTVIPHKLEFSGETIKDSKTGTIIMLNEMGSAVILSNLKFNFLLILPYSPKWTFTFFDYNLLSGNAGFINLSLDIFDTSVSADQFLLDHKNKLQRESDALCLTEAKIKEFGGDKYLKTVIDMSKLGGEVISERAGKAVGDNFKKYLGGNVKQVNYFETKKWGDKLYYLHLSKIVKNIQEFEKEREMAYIAFITIGFRVDFMREE